MQNRFWAFIGIMILCWMGLYGEAFGQEKVTVEVHYVRYNEDYEDWNLWIWTGGNGGQAVPFKERDSDVSAEFVLELKEEEDVGILVRKGDWEEKDIDEDRFLDLDRIKDGRLTIWLWQGDQTIYYEEKEIGVRIMDAALASQREITFRAYCPEGISFGVEDKDGKEYAIAVTKISRDGLAVSGGITLREPVELPNTFYLTMGEAKTCIRLGGIYDTDYFKENFLYDGSDLGADCNEKRCTFKVWSPAAEEVSLLLYEKGNGGEAADRYPMERGEKGVWFLTLAGNHRGRYYTYLVNVQGSEREAVDPYALSTGLNGERGMVLAKGDGRPEGFEKDSFIKDIPREDVILYEMSVRDYTSGEASGVTEKGKFIGLTEEGCVNPSGESTGLSYLSELGITHVHLLPIQDFGGVDESDPSESYNWGYNPMNYFVPEGSYATDPYDGLVRVKECRQMVQSFRNKGIGVVLDVVFNHTYQGENSNFERIVPGYYHRFTRDGTYSDGSACGNELATERDMVRKYILDALKYWMEEYHVDGFRFDLMGLMDLETMKLVEKEVYQINPEAVLYGEGWDAGETVYEGERMESLNARFTPRIGTFNNVFRRAVQNYICGIVDKRDTLIGMEFGFAGAVKNPNTKDAGSWTENPLQCINYASCHDGYTLWDLIGLNCPQEDEEMWKQRDRFGAACVLLCQGTPFLHSGEEFLRTKTSEQDPQRKYGNSFEAGDYVNAIDWRNRSENRDILSYYKGLIAFRKSHKGLRYKTAEKLNDNLVFIEGLPENVMGYYIKEPESLFFDNQICLLFNPLEEAVEYSPFFGEWEIFVNEKTAGTTCITTVQAGSPLIVEKSSALAAVRKVVSVERSLILAAGILVTAGILWYGIRKNRKKRELLHSLK